MPLVGTRRFDVHTKRTFMNRPVNRRGSNEELVVSESVLLNMGAATIIEASGNSV
jgi:hypothetical protein